MSPHEILEFVLNYWQYLLVSIVVITPILWLILHFLFINRLQEKSSIINQLKKEVSELKKNHFSDLSTRFTQSKSNQGIQPSLDSSLISLFVKTNVASQDDLFKRITNAKEKINIFGLTRNFYVSDNMIDLLHKKSLEIPIVFYIMNPNCNSRTARYRIEPLEAALDDPNKFVREIELPIKELLKITKRTVPGTNLPGISYYYYNFPCSFAIEEIDNVCRVMLYGHGKRGTESPIFVFKKGNDYFNYFSSQIRWIEKFAVNDVRPQWVEKNIIVEELK